MAEQAKRRRRGFRRKRQHRRGVRASLRTYFLTGLIVAAPIAITVYITYWFVVFVDETVAQLLPVKLNPSTYLPFTLPGLGVIIALIALILIGFLTTNYLGRAILRLGESILDQMPVVRSVYSALKQLFEAVFSQGGTSFRQVCVVEYPRTGTWAIAFVTTEDSGEIAEHIGHQMIGLFVPTTPNPTSGYLIYVRPEEVHVLDMSVEDAMKLVVSGGVVKVGPNAEEEGEDDPETGGADGEAAQVVPANAAAPSAAQPERNSRAAASRSNR
ncbi:MAG: DUF502 domain-containing protein [Sneathiellaceae bacterium]